MLDRESAQAASPILYGPNTPFTVDERKAIEPIYPALLASHHPESDKLAREMRQQMVSLEWLGEVLSQYPSPLNEQSLGQRQRGMNTLTETLCNANPANFDFLVPTRALLGRALDMAEGNFYRFLRHVCQEAIHGEDREKLLEGITDCLRVCLHTKLAEEVLTSIVSDNSVDRETRCLAVGELAQIWERRLTYRVSEFFPLLESTWEARRCISVRGGTLLGTEELFSLFQAGADPKFVGFFARPNHSDDEVQAFREFLFAASTEELDRLNQEMQDQEMASVSMHDMLLSSQHDVATVFYEFFRMRHQLAMARKMADMPGPKKTAEAYVMIWFLHETR